MAAAPAFVALPLLTTRLSDILLSFPCAAISGVRWHVLASKYEERHTSRLDTCALGFASPAAAAAVLLEGVGMAAGHVDEHDPLIFIVDKAAVVARPHLLGCWPALYHALCQAVLQHGSPAGARSFGGELEGLPFSLLLSKVRPLLERWRGINLDEHALGYLSEDGTFVRLAKLKHVVNALLGWRAERQAWCREGRCVAGIVDEVLRPRLKFLAAGAGQDLLLCYPPGADLEEGIAAAELACQSRGAALAAHEGLDTLRWELQQEAQQNQLLKAENQRLRMMQPGCPGVQQAILVPFICLPLPSFLNATSGTPMPPLS